MLVKKTATMLEGQAAIAIVTTVPPRPSVYFSDCHIRNDEGLASFRQRGPRIPQALIMFALWGIGCLLCQRGIPSGSFPRGLAL